MRLNGELQVCALAKHLFSYGVLLSHTVAHPQLLCIGILFASHFIPRRLLCIRQPAVRVFPLKFDDK